MIKLNKFIACAAAVASIGFASTASAFGKSYTVSITNITKGIYFTPFLVTTHSSAADLFEVGTPASEELGVMAEGGDVSGLVSVLEASGQARSIATGEGLLAPGQTVEFEVEAWGRDRLSATAMLLPTNDAFAGLDSVALPRFGSHTYYALAYDAGTEANDELCMSIPGPMCGGEPFSPEDEGEGYVIPHAGIHGEGELSRAEYNWQGAVVKVVITRNRY